MSSDQPKLKSIDPIAHIRRNARMYFGTDEPTVDQLALRMLVDLTARVEWKHQSAKSVGKESHAKLTVLQVSESWAIIADFDWLFPKDEDTTKVFFEGRSFPEGGGNAIRSEPMLTAFARNIIVLSEFGMLRIKGDVSALSLITSRINLTPGWVRAVAFNVS